VEAEQNSTDDNDDEDDEVIQMDSTDHPDNSRNCIELLDHHYLSSDAERSAALFILKAKEDRMLTQSALNGIIQDVTGNNINMMLKKMLLKNSLYIGFMQQQNEKILTNIKKIMSQTEEDFCPKLNQYIDAVSESRPFDRLETEHLQKKYFKENFQLLV